MQYNDIVAGLVEHNGPDQSYATGTAFLGWEAERRLTTEDLASEDMWSRGQGGQVLGIEHAAGKVWVMCGSTVALRPTPEYARLTRVGAEAPYAWRFDERNLLDQIDDICTSNGLRLVAARVSNGSWRAFFADLPGVPREKRRRTPTSHGDSLGAALWSAISIFRAQRDLTETVPEAEICPAKSKTTGASLETRLAARLRCLISGVEALSETVELNDGRHALVKTARLEVLRGVTRRTNQDLADGAV